MFSAVWDNLNLHYDGKDEPLGAIQRPPWRVEIWFSILHRRIIRYGDFGSTEHQKNEV